MMRSLVGTPLLPVPPPLPPPPPSGGRVPRTPHDGTAAEARRCAITAWAPRSSPLLPIPPPLPLPSGGRVSRTPHDGTAAEATHAIMCRGGRTTPRRAETSSERGDARGK
jgi:hypothetical protein